MSNVGTLSIDLALQSAQFLAGLRQAQVATTQAARSISTAFEFAKGAAIGFVGALSIDVLSGAINRAFDYADAIQDLSDRTGASTTKIQEWRYAAQLGGASVEILDGAVEKFSKNLGAAANGSDSMNKTMRNLGVTSNNVDIAFRQAADGIAKLPTAQQRAAATTELFGKKAQSLTLTLSGGAKGLDEMADKANDLGIVLDSGLIANAGKVNDQLDTMKMIVNAEMASAIVKNADAIQSMALGMTNLVSSLVKFWGANPAKAMAIMGGIGGALVGGRLAGGIGALVGGIGGAAGGAVMGRDMMNQTYASNPAWKRAKDMENWASREQQKLVSLGLGKSGASERIGQVGLRARATQQRLEKGFQDGSIDIYPDLGLGGNTNGGGDVNLPTPKTKPTKTKASSSKPMKSDAELAANWEKSFLGARSDLFNAQADLTPDVNAQADLKAQSLKNSFFINNADLIADTGSDAEVREGKKKYTAAQATILRGLEQEIYNAEYDKIMQDRDEAISRQKLDIGEAGLRNVADDLSSQQALARSSRERRDIALRMVDNQYAQEKLALEATLASKQATDAEKQIATERLKMIPTLIARGKDQARQQNMGPLEAFLNEIPKTGDEINDAMETVEVDGLNSLQEGLMGVIKGTQSVGEAFSSMADTVVSGLMKIALQQMIIKPLGNLLFGGGSEGGGSGIFGSIIGAVSKGLTGKRANGGLTGPGDYLVGERGPEIVRMGAPSNVIPTRALKSYANDNGGGVNVTISNITSNDPDAIRRAAMEGVMAAMPSIAQQASDKTMARLSRRSL